MKTRRGVTVSLCALGLCGGLLTVAAEGDRKAATRGAATMAEAVVMALSATLPLRDSVRCQPSNGAQPPPSRRPLATVAFADARLGSTESPRRVSGGGAVEVLVSAEDAKRRRELLERQIRAAQRLGYDEGGRPLDEHIVVSGRVVLRLSSALSEKQAGAYARRLSHVSTRAHPVPPHTMSLEVAPCST